VSAFLIEPQQHDAYEMADMEAVGGTVVTEISGDGASDEQRVERGLVGALMDVAALAGGGEKGRTNGRHSGVI
jgi:hypothetical protein